jgi:Ni,Fe-hydrogenase III large subunit
LIGGPNRRTLQQMETIAGDTTVGHAGAYCMVREVLGGYAPSPRTEAIRAVALELERLANHTGDLGALAGDVGYLPTMSYCGRIRGDFLNMTALICGSRFGRGLLVPGGIAFDPAVEEIDELLSRLAAARSDLTSAVELLWAAPSVINRFDQCGTVSAKTARQLGLVGPAARASGVAQDIRRDLPWGQYRKTLMPVAVMQSGDVYARAQLRWQECRHSLDFIEETLRHLPPGGPADRPRLAIPDGMVAVALTEGWRGEICHVAVSGDDGSFRRYKVKDPSFHNWTGLALALRQNEISDFPLNNKSFNLSYCGYDL